MVIACLPKKEEQYLRRFSAYRKAEMRSVDEGEWAMRPITTHWGRRRAGVDLHAQGFQGLALTLQEGNDLQQIGH